MKSSYSSLVFDCDGVVLNSNRIKTQAFYNTALPYGKAVASALVAYHVQNGGISRYLKFKYLLSHLAPPNATGPTLEQLLDIYAGETRKGLLFCEVASGLHKLREQTIGLRWFMVSGGAQSELHEIFQQRGLADLFDGGIYGSPDTKDDILQRLIDNNHLIRPALFLGDSRYDHQSAQRAGLDFVFVSAWSEFPEWSTYCGVNGIPVVGKLDELMDFVK